MTSEVNGDLQLDSATIGVATDAHEQDLTGPPASISSFGWRWLERTPIVAAIYALFGVLIYWPVLLGKRFFWEDFFIQEYPIREFCYYMVRFQHQLPFWNPYSWAWSPMLSDAQCGFWYPGNLFGIAVTWLLAPHAVHLPVIVPEVITLLHLPFAALGVFVLLRRRFQISPLAALVAGLTWGFGVRMVAEQNHSMQIIQLSLLPWETILLMGAWRSWRLAVALGLVFGVSFLAGQPQTYLFVAIFMASFTLAEVVQRARRNERALQPILLLALAMIISVGVASIQLLPSMELVSHSAREHLTYDKASGAGIHLGHFMNFFVPKFFGEHPGFNFPKTDTVTDQYWYWEATFYWSTLGEIIALFAILHWWKKRKTVDTPTTRYLTFFVVFSVLALAYGMGKNLYFQWLFWRFVPFFDTIRAPNRMIWFLWFIGSLLVGVGLNALLKNPGLLKQHRKYFLRAGGLFVIANVIAMSGVLDRLFKPYHVRQGLWAVILPSLMISAICFVFLWLAVRQKIGPKLVVPAIAFLISLDLLYTDTSWHRNTLSRETVVAQDSSSAAVQDFRRQHDGDHSKLMLLYGPTRGRRANLGMFIRMPIEYADSIEDITELNPLRLQWALPPVKDKMRRLEIMGISSMDVEDSIRQELPNALPFLKLYHRWKVADTTEMRTLLRDTAFDYHTTVVVDHDPSLPSASEASGETAKLLAYSENHLKAAVTSPQPALLLVNDLYYPAWKTTVDGKDVNVLRAFSSLRAVPLPAGEHTVEMRYDDTAFSLRWKISVVTILAALLSLVFGRKSRKALISQGPSESKVR